MEASHRASLGEFEQLEATIRPMRERVTGHAVYTRLSSLGALRVFMENHVFAVWDFMSLVKALQRRLTCVDHPWLPPLDTIAARMINEIVLSEETDEVAPGRYVGHFHLYLAAMQEVDADTRPIRDLIASLRKGMAPEPVLAALPMLESTRRFVLGTMRLVAAPSHQLAAAFLFGRENLVPEMFRTVLAVLERQGVGCQSFRTYLQRHVQLDEGAHDAMARRILEGLCTRDADRWREATLAGMEALAARRSLWDGVVRAAGPVLIEPA
jgi:hypothetical protein